MLNDNSYHIMIVDDNSQNIQVAANILKTNDITISFARSGKEAIDRLEKRDYDLILMDVMMPEMDGFEASRIIKSNSKFSNIPIIFVTAKIGDDALLEGFYSGGVDYVTKPYKAKELLARVNTHLKLKRLLDNLEKEVKEETTKRLVQQELLLKQSRLAAMGEMMRAIIHQWNQPLTVISLSLSLIEMSLDESEIDRDELIKNVSTAQNNISFMEQTARDFRNFFNPSKNKVKFSVIENVEAILKMLTPQLKIHSIKIKLEIDKNLSIYGIASEFKQVILNLISNAKDAITDKTNSKSEGYITILAFATEEKVVIDIEDSGDGIAEDILPKIFDNQFSTKADKGTGIGLSMSKLIIEESFNGVLRAENRDSGASLIIEIPI